MGDLIVTVKDANGPEATCEFNGKTYVCAVGKNGAVAAEDHREGDWRSPLGRWKIIGGFYRPDKVARPESEERVWVALTKEMGWCDAPDDEKYNRPVPVGYPASHEVMWRQDDAYDYILVLDHNQNPVVPGLGSAIFLHVMREGEKFTAGCIALRRQDLEEVLAAEAVEIKLA